jgi:hypothetical protein
MSKYIDTIKRITKENKINYHQKSIDIIKAKIEQEANNGNNKLLLSIYNIDVDMDNVDMPKLQKHFKTLGFRVKEIEDKSSIHPATQISW